MARDEKDNVPGHERRNTRDILFNCADHPVVHELPDRLFIGLQERFLPIAWAE